MELIPMILGVSGMVILLLAWPAWHRERRHRFQQAQQWEHQQTSQQERQWECSGIDVGCMAQRIERLRRDYVAEVHSRQFSQCFHESLLAAARQAISRLSFFTRRHVDDEHNNAA
jgi:hypothetical protein